MIAPGLWTATVPLSCTALPFGPLTYLPLSGLECTLVREPVTYMLVAVRPNSDLNTLAGQVDEERERVARALGVTFGPSVPKLGFVWPVSSAGVDLAFRTRKQQPPSTAPGAPPVDTWHPGVPGTGLAALANAALDQRSVVGRLCRPGSTSWAVATPAGVKHLRLSEAGVVLSLGAVTLGGAS